MKHTKLFFTLSIAILINFFPLAAYGTKKEVNSWIEQGHIQQQYKKIIQYFKAKKYSKAKTYIEEILPLITDEKKFPKIKFYEAYCNFYEGEYLISSNQFRHFYKKHAQRSEVEEAMYMEAYALYSIMPDIRLDKTNTENAIKKLQAYVDAYPTGKYCSQVADHVKILTDKLAEKQFKVAVFYYNLAQYRAALISVEHFQQEFDDSHFNEQVAYLKTKIQYKLTKKASEQKVQKKELQNTIYHCQSFLKQYPNSSKKKKIQNIIIKLTKNKI